MAAIFRLNGAKTNERDESIIFVSRVQGTGRQFCMRSGHGVRMTCGSPGFQVTNSLTNHSSIGKEAEKQLSVVGWEEMKT